MWADPLLAVASKFCRPTTIKPRSHPTAINHAQLSEETTSNSQWGRDRTKLMYEIALLSPSKLTVLRSEETATDRWGKDATGHREGIIRCFPASQIVFRRHQCACKTLRSAPQQNRPMILLTSPSQESKDVQDKLGDLEQWLTKLKGSLTTASAGVSCEEAERRKELMRFVSHLHCRAFLILSNLPQIYGRYRQTIPGTIEKENSGPDPG